MTQRFEGTSSYIATEDLKVAVNAAVTLRRPLLVKGEPGTGKTVLAHDGAYERIWAAFDGWCGGHLSQGETDAVAGGTAARLYQFDELLAGAASSRM